MFERLTYWDEEYGCWSYKCASGDAANRLAEYEDTGLEPKDILAGKELAEIACALSELKRYKEDKQERRMIVLPCKPRDTVYNIDGEAFIVYNVEARTNVVTPEIRIRIYAEPKNKKFDELHFWGDDIGKTVFLSRIETEKALRESVGSDHD